MPHNDSIGKLAARSLVVLHCRVPGVTTYATLAANAHKPESVSDPPGAYLVVVWLKEINSK